MSAEPLHRQTTKEEAEKIMEKIEKQNSHSMDDLMEATPCIHIVDYPILNSHPS